MTRSGSTRYKWIVLLLLVGALAAVLFVGPEGFRSGNNIPIATLPAPSNEAVAQQPEADGPSADEAPNSELGPTEAPDTVPAIARPTIDNGTFRLEDNVQILRIEGTVDEQCDIVVLFDGVPLDSVVRSGNTWFADVSSPNVGDREAKAECYFEGELIDFYVRSVQIKGPEGEAEPVADELDTAGESANDGDGTASEEVVVEESAGTEESATESETATEAESTDAVVDGTAPESESAETPSEEAESPATEEATTTEEAAATEEPTAEPTNEDDVVITGELSELRFANEMDDWNYGYLLVRGRGTPGASVAVIFTNGTSIVESASLVNETGDWAVRGFLDEPGTYQVSARSGENSAEVGSVTVADGIVFGAPGLCVGRTPAFGQLIGNEYTVADCEFFGLIAKRLGVSIADLRAANPQIINLNLIQAGNVLNVPPLP